VKKLYHGTSCRRAKRIAKEGLVAEERIHEESDLGFDFDTGEVVDLTESVYLTSSFSEAKQYAEITARRERSGKPCVVVVVNQPAKRVEGGAGRNTIPMVQSLRET
jgi:RNA:NAD 2'-phosphotransferase (TPT1/KptA family)